mmetsp:Transcript_17686/g.29799  ORF Transcript_17686/g.29799 Transcript_17686/m.29799 type:complete len:126 (-) Transcript_17686:74-451(-)
MLKCYQCHRWFLSTTVKHLPGTMNNDHAIFERAKAAQKHSRQIYPTLGVAMKVPTSLEAQQHYLEQMQEEQAHHEHVKHGHETIHDLPFCSWQCAKRWAFTSYSVQKKYENGILIDIAAGYTVEV